MPLVGGGGLSKKLIDILNDAGGGLLRNCGSAEEWSVAEQRLSTGSVASGRKLLNSWMFNTLANHCNLFQLWRARDKAEEWRKSALLREEWSDHPCFMWHLRASPGMSLSLCHTSLSVLLLHTLFVTAPHAKVSVWVPSGGYRRNPWCHPEPDPAAVSCRWGPWSCRRCSSSSTSSCASRPSPKPLPPIPAAALPAARLL